MKQSPFGPRLRVELVPFPPAAFSCRARSSSSETRHLPRYPRHRPTTSLRHRWLDYLNRTDNLLSSKKNSTNQRNTRSHELNSRLFVVLHIEAVVMNPTTHVLRVNAVVHELSSHLFVVLRDESKTWTQTVPYVSIAKLGF